MAASTRQKYRFGSLSRPSDIDLYDYARTVPAPRRGRPPKRDLADWIVIDDWPDPVPVTAQEVDVIEAWLGDILDELFGPE